MFAVVKSIKSTRIVAATLVRRKFGQVVLREINQTLLKDLVCPLTKQPLIYDSIKRELISPTAGVAFTVLSDGTINLNPREGRMLDEHELEHYQKR